MIGKRTLSLLITLLLLLSPSVGVQAQAQDQDRGAAGFFDFIPWRHIGPAVFGGRISDVEANPLNPAEIYVADG